MSTGRRSVARCVEILALRWAIVVGIIAVVVVVGDGGGDGGSGGLACRCGRGCDCCGGRGS